MAQHQPGLAAMAALAVALSSAPVGAARLLTAPDDYTGPTLSIGGLGGSSFLFTNGPLALPGGITFTATPGKFGFAAIGVGIYDLEDNGFSDGTPIIATDGAENWIDLTFDTPVAMFGGGFNYARFEGTEDSEDSFIGLTPTISAYDADGNLIAAFDLFELAPIVTLGAVNEFLFRGIDGEGAMIKRFRLQGSFLAMTATGSGTAPEPPAIPEPATWAMMIAGFGPVGFAARRRRAVAAA